MRKGSTYTGDANYYRKGSYNVICDYSGIKCKAEDTKMTWDGLRVHKDWWEARHPQDFVAKLRDKQSVPNPRPEQTPTFVAATYPYMELESSSYGDTIFLGLEGNTLEILEFE